MSNAITTTNESNIIESVVIGGDLSKLSPEQRVSYYQAVCRSLGLNPLTKPFDYITLNGKLTLYARKDAADQLRRINHISIDKPDIQFEGDWIIVAVLASTPDGRTDSDLGVVNKKDMQANFGNALMKAVTKAKRRVTLSICGLGMLDETEVETIPDARPVIVAETGEILQPALPPKTNGGGKPDEKAWKAWYALAEKAEALGLQFDEPPANVTTDHLREMYGSLRELVKTNEPA